MSRIMSDGDLERHLDELRHAHPVFDGVARIAGAVPLRWLDPGFAGLVWVITGQQISVAASHAIFSRLETAAGAITPEALRALTDDELRAAGYSRGKIATLRALQTALLDGGLDLDALLALDAEDAIAALCAIKGIGPWTAEVYLLFAAGHPDIFPAGDVALQEAARMAFGGDERPTSKALRKLAETWSPQRSIAARVLWTYYRAKRGGTSGVPV